MLRKLDTTCIIWTPILYWASQETQVAKNLSANTGATGEWVQSLGQNDALEEKMAIHSRFLAGIILWTEEPGGLHSMESQRIGHNRAWKHLTLLTKISLKWIKDVNKRHKTKNLREGLEGNLHSLVLAIFFFPFWIWHKKYKQ